MIYDIYHILDIFYKYIIISHFIILMWIKQCHKQTMFTIPQSENHFYRCYVYPHT